MLTMFIGITLEYEQSGALKSKTIDLLDLKAKYDNYIHTLMCRVPVLVLILKLFYKRSSHVSL